MFTHTRHFVQVSCYPDVTVHERQDTDDLLLLACDGLWDVMTTAEAVAQVRELYESGERSVSKIAEELLDVSLKKGTNSPFVVNSAIQSLTALSLPFPPPLVVRLEGQHQRDAGEAARRRARA